MRVLGTALYNRTDNLGDSATDQLLENEHLKFSRPKSPGTPVYARLIAENIAAVAGHTDVG